MEITIDHIRFAPIGTTMLEDNGETIRYWRTQGNRYELWLGDVWSGPVKTPPLPHTMIIFELAKRYLYLEKYATEVSTVLAFHDQELLDDSQVIDVVSIGMYELRDNIEDCLYRGEK